MRQLYYDLFSKIYDPIIRLHSRDRAGSLRGFITDRTRVSEEDRALDLCTGTGSVAVELAKRAGKTGLVVGLDFSPVLFDHGIDVICGTKVIDSERLIRFISQGATFKEVSGVRLLTLIK